MGGQERAKAGQIRANYTKFDQKIKIFVFSWCDVQLCTYVHISQSGRGHQDDRAKIRSRNNQRLDHKIGLRRIYYMFPHMRLGQFFEPDLSMIVPRLDFNV